MQAVTILAPLSLHMFLEEQMAYTQCPRSVVIVLDLATIITLAAIRI